MKFAIHLISLFLLTTTAFADGIYVTADKKHAEGEHIIIKLTDKQLTDVETNRKVTLTTKQLADILKINKKFPSTLQVLTSRWDDCTCGIGAYAIWCRIGELDIPTNGIRYYDNLENNKFDEGEPVDGKSGIKIVMDSNGKMYVNGKAVTFREVKILANKLQLPEKKSTLKKYIIVDTPPPINKKIDGKISRELELLSGFSKDNQISFYAIGYLFDRNQ